PAAAPRDAEPWRLWLSLVLAVSVEFCVVFWAPSYLHSNLGLRTATASALAGGFLLGMATGRASVTPVTRRLGTGNRTIFVVLATISDAAGLHAAYLLVPVLCAALVINTRLIHRSTAT